MKYELYTDVKIITNKYKDKGVLMGAIGIILEQYDGGYYEVQFYDEKGEPSTLCFAVKAEDITVLQTDI